VPEREPCVWAARRGAKLTKLPICKAQEILKPECTGDYHPHFADFDSYATAQKTIGKDFGPAHQWAVRALKNTARTSMFSSDRTIKEYTREI
jgi:glucan phosphorylase